MFNPLYDGKKWNGNILRETEMKSATLAFKKKRV
jgi:hypothetical protein